MKTIKLALITLFLLTSSMMFAQEKETRTNQLIEIKESLGEMDHRFDILEKQMQDLLWYQKPWVLIIP